MKKDRLITDKGRYRAKACKNKECDTRNNLECSYCEFYEQQEQNCVKIQY